MVLIINYVSQDKFQMFAGNQSIANGLDMGSAEWCDFPFHFQPQEKDIFIYLLECVSGPLTGRYLYVFSYDQRQSERSRELLHAAGPAIETGGKTLHNINIE